MEKVLHSIDIASMKGIEIGPLHNPRIGKETANVRYLDHASADELRAKYAGNPNDLAFYEDIVDVDFVWRPGQTLAETVGEWAPVDFVVASHLIEHIPDMVGWLGQVADLLADNGILSLIVPDKRYCFDAKRQETTLAQLVDSALRRRQVATFQQIFDHESNFAGEVDTAALWAGMDPTPLRRSDVDSPERHALQRCLAQRDTGAYVDVHCSTFTPQSFVRILTGLAELDWLSFGVDELYYTETGSFEFFVTLRRLPRDIPRTQRLDLQRGSLARAATRFPVVDVPTPPPLPPPEPEPAPEPPDLAGLARSMEVSEREERFIHAKRRGLGALRRAIHRPAGSGT
ncbi:MAG: class I SAM-dependent methyltransferase [Actinomycetota bacterium]|nr:class I SAM-dependent methyltransferase [Actinomycetota bacterium]